MKTLAERKAGGKTEAVATRRATASRQPTAEHVPEMHTDAVYQG